jgi:hypothetical protein
MPAIPKRGSTVNSMRMAGWPARPVWIEGYSAITGGRDYTAAG